MNLSRAFFTRLYQAVRTGVELHQAADSCLYLSTPVYICIKLFIAVRTNLYLSTSVSKRIELSMAVHVFMPVVACR